MRDYDFNCYVHIYEVSNDFRRYNADTFRCSQLIVKVIVESHDERL